jgi:micrococcal nuclease
MCKKLAALALITFALLNSALASTGTQEIEVGRVLDGDTVEIKGSSERVRLSSIDAPEASHGYNKPGQAFSVASRDYLTALVMGPGGAVSMTCYSRDERYGRNVCEIFRNGQSLNREMVKAGMAMAYTGSRGRYLHDKELVGIQEQAKVQRRGIWSEKDPTPPWEWRIDCWINTLCTVKNNDK